MIRQYILTQDLRRLLQLWAARDPQVLPALPPRPFFDNLHFNLVGVLRGLQQRTYGREVRVVSYRWREFCALIQDAISDSASFDATVSLDRVYVPTATAYVEWNRINGLDGAAFPALGDGPRPGALPLSTQIAQVAGALRAAGHRRLLLVDEGVFSGGSVGRVAEELTREGLDVVGIAVGFHRVQPHVTFPVPLAAGAALPQAECLDWICERDFFPGVPLSGRTLGFLQNGEPVPHPDNIGLSYLAGFGDVVEWASIPAGEGWAFTRSCLHLTIELFEALARARGGQPLRVCELQRKVHGLAADPDDHYVDCLRARVEALGGP